MPALRGPPSFGIGRDAELEPDQPVVGKQRPLLHGEALDLSCDQPLALSLVDRRVLRQAQAGQLGAKELAAASAGEIAEGPVHLCQAPVRALAEIDQGDPDRRVLESAPEASVRLHAGRLYLDDLRDVLAHTDDPLHLARRRVHDRLALAADAADLSVGPDDAVLEAEGDRVAERGFDLSTNLELLIGMDALEVRGEGLSERVRVLLSLDTEDPVELLGPVDLVFGQPPFPAAEIGDSLRVRHQIGCRPQLLARAVRKIGTVIDPRHIVCGRQAEQTSRRPVSPTRPPHTT